MPRYNEVELCTDIYLICCSEAVVSQVLDELGLQMADQLSGNILFAANGSSFIMLSYM